MQLNQSVSAIKGGIKKNKFSKLVLYALQRSRCTLEKGSAVIQARDIEAACKSSLCRRGGAVELRRCMN